MAKKVEKQVERENPIDAILDPHNENNIVLTDEDGNEVEFEQVAVVPLADDSIYVILHPANDPTVKENEAVVFVIDLDEDEMEYYLDYVDDEAVLQAVFDEYNKMFKNEQ